MVGNYERYKVQDQQTIQRLKERMSQLDLENTALSRSASQIKSYDEEWGSLEAAQLGDLIVNLQGFLREANQRAATPVLLEGDQCLQNVKRSRRNISVKKCFALLLVSD